MVLFCAQLFWSKICRQTLPFLLVVVKYCSLHSPAVDDEVPVHFVSRPQELVHERHLPRNRGKLIGVPTQQACFTATRFSNRDLHDGGRSMKNNTPKMLTGSCTNLLLGSMTTTVAPFPSHLPAIYHSVESWALKIRRLTHNFPVTSKLGHQPGGPSTLEHHDLSPSGPVVRGPSHVRAHYVRARQVSELPW